MVNAIKAPYWRATVATELDSNSHLSALINDKCSICHAPMANYEITNVQGNNITPFGPDYILNTNQVLHYAGLNGVICTCAIKLLIMPASLHSMPYLGAILINHTKTIYGQYTVSYRTSGRR